jgi:hypothetical protein
VNTNAQPTTIDIEPDMSGYNVDSDDPYFRRTDIDFRISSTTKFERIVFSHLGFRAWSKGKGDYHIRRKGDRYISGGTLEAEVSALVEIKPFQICFVNVGDSFLKVNVRMRDGIKQCKMTILQEEYQPKVPKEIDTFVEYEGIYYCTAIIGCLQTIRIEELKEGV